MLAAADPAAQLVELREPEAVGPLDDDGRRVLDVDAHLHDGFAATSRSVRLAAKPSMAACFSSLRWPPWASPTVKSANGLCHEALGLGRCRTAWPPPLLDEGQITYAWRPATGRAPVRACRDRTRAPSASRRARGPGRPRIVETLRSP